MPTHTWTIDMKDIDRTFRESSKIWARYYRNEAVERQKYFEGFNVGREKKMFKEELNDLETVYKTALENYAKEIEDVLPSLLHYMERFLKVHKQNEAISEKLEVLLAKTGRQPQDEDGDCDSCGGCNE